jgi:hypothetical protein
MDKDSGLILLKNVIEKEIYHQDYEHVVELADKYYKMKTGDEITDLLEKIVTRETEEEFEQRENISKSVIPSILNSTMLPFQKAVRKQPLIKELIFKGADKSIELEKSISKYWGERSLDEYLEYAIIDYNYTDPNAFLITEFDPFDPNTEKASPYPFIATSKEAIMFEYKNENLKYLIVRLAIKYESNKNKVDGYKFTMYLGEYTIQLTQVEGGYIITEPAEDKPVIIKIEENYYLYQEFTPKASKVPAQRFGYLRDTETKGRTFVSVFHPVILLLEKLMKTDSELDLSTAMTAFPQRFAYVDKCSNKECLSGKLLDGNVCPTCNGTGQQMLHGGVKDVITLTLPRNPTEMIDLEKMLVYKMPPIELLDFNKQYINDLRILIHTMMFNNEIATRSEVATAVTATEMNFGTDNMNDTLYPFARNYSSLWKFVVNDIATFTDLGEGITINHKFPSDFKLKSLTILMTELKTAKDAGASTSTITAIEDDINEILYSDRPTEKKKIEIKSLVNPFRGYNEGTVRLIISQGLTTEANAVLYSNLESIFNDLELEIPNLYDMNIKVIKDKVTAKTQEYMKQMKAEVPEPSVNPFNN